MAPTLLIVDDEPNFCRSLDVLFTAEEYRVEVAQSGEEALFLLDQNAYDALLLDIGLPDIYGNSIAAYAAKHRPETAVIILTGNASLDNAVEALRHGVYDYLRKPCDPGLLVRTVARAIEHNALKRQLCASEKRFRQLSLSTWEGIVIYEQGHLLQTNPQLCDMFGYREEELLGRQVFDLLLDRDSIKVLNLQTDPETIGPFEAYGIRKDGSRFPVELRVKHIDHEGRQVQVAAIRDVTANKVALEQKVALQEKLADAKRMEALGLMAGSVAHDLNNIMAGLITYPELLLLDADADFKYREELIMIRDAGKRAAAVVNDLLTVARGASCKKEPQNLNLLVSCYLNSVEYREMRQRFPGIEVDSALEAKLGNVSCSAGHILKSVINLVNNAAEAIVDQGRISISTCSCRLQEPLHAYETIEPGEYAAIMVSDNGPGISETDKARIFSPFYSKKYMGRSGTGLGLAVVWNTVHDHDGFIDLQSSKQGTTFSLYLPVTRDEVSIVDSKIPLQKCLGNGQRVLVVDDQQSQCEIASRLLSRLGYNPLTVNSGEEALEFLQTEKVDLVILDMIMDPGISGCETYERILKAMPGLPAIVTSGYSDAADIERARNLGIRQFVKKPYSLQDLGQALKLEIR